MDTPRDAQKETVRPSDIAIPTWGRHSQSLPYIWTHMGEIDITRDNHSDGYTGKQSDTPRKTQSGKQS